ncbi:methyltransferase [Pseudoscourfieldia marina]
MKNLLLVCLVTLLHWATSAAALRIFPSASTSPVLCEAEKRAISPGTEVRVATVRVDNTDKSFRIATYGKNDIVSGSILAHGRWEPSTLEHLKTALAEREGSVYLDIGANIGYFALYVAALGYKVIAVEASQENANLIRYSLCLNPELKSRIKLHHVALADKRMRCTMASPEGNVGEMVMDCKEVGRGIDVNNWFRRTSEDTVNTVPLDEVVGKDERVDVLKIDTEGFEYHALVGGQKHVLPKIRSVYSEFSPFMLRKQHTDPVAYLELLRKHGLQVHYQDDIVRDYATLTAQFPKDGIDIAAVRDSTRGQKTEVDTLSSFLAWQRTLESRERKVFSQQGEDGVLEAIFEYIGTMDKYYVEFGTESGVETNTRYLLEQKGWSGLLMDGGNENPSINLHKEVILPSNIVELFEKYRVSQTFDLLSIDIDSYDLWVWRRLLKAGYRPRVVVVEFNRNFEDTCFMTFPDPTDSVQHRWEFDMVFGASLAALELLASHHDYKLIYTDQNSINAFFIRNDLLPDGVVEALPLSRVSRGAHPIHPAPTRAREGILVDFLAWSKQHDSSQRTLSLPSSMCKPMSKETLESPKRSQVSFTPWVKRKLGCVFMAESGNGPNNARAWWQRFWEPCIACKDEERIGRIGDGGKWICDPQLVLSKPCSVLSVGSSNEFSFEREMVERFRCTIHIYDHTSIPPTPGVDIPAHLMHLVKFHRTAFGTTVVDEQTTTLSVMVDNLIQAAGTDRVDIFKIDCEGCEFSSFQSPENVQIVQKKVVQMQMEIHFGPNSLQQVSNLWFAMVNKFGMVPFHKEANIEFPMGGDGLALELAFLNQMYVKHEVREVKPPANEKRATT